MRTDETEMNDGLGDPTTLRLYLLGNLNDDVTLTRIEERLLTDEEFVLKIDMAESDLIEDYFDGKLGVEDSKHFNQFFLTPNERKRQAKLVNNLRMLAAKAESTKPKTSRSFASLVTVFSLPRLRFAVLALLLVTAGLGIWRFAIYKSDTDKGLAQLREAYRGQRPVQSRISALTEYSPLIEARGAQQPVTDQAALDRAKYYFAEATNGRTDAGAHQALGILYLAGRDLKRAESELKLAVDLAPKDARIQSDAGAVYLEIAKDASSRNDGATTLEMVNESLKHLETAISLDPKLLEARFDKALSLQLFFQVEQAKIAWREYLELDPNSKWAEEAKHHLQDLEDKTPRESSAEELESNFLAAFRAGDEAEAGKLLKQNHELIRDKYLPSRLAMSYLTAPEGRREELLSILQFAGHIELKQTGDSFANEIAGFYSSLPASKKELLIQAHISLRAGLRLCLNLHYADSLSVFQKVQKTFNDAGDIWNARLAQYFVGYALINNHKPNDALAEFMSVEAWGRDRKFTWLNAIALHWIASCYINLRLVTNAIRTYERALDMSKSLDDSYGIQRNLSMLAYFSSFCGLHASALKYIFASIKESDRSETSLRQRYRNLLTAFPIVSEAGLLNVALPIAKEAVAVADQQNDEMYMTQSRVFAGAASAQLGRLAEARGLLEESRTKAADNTDESTRELDVALSNLYSADFERSQNNFESAEGFYLHAIGYYDQGIKFPLYQEQAHLGLLQTYLALGKNDELAEQIPTNIRLTEDYRSKISDEEQSIGFFDSRENIYDIAAQFELNHDDQERAYNYTEMASSRSLLEHMQRDSMPVYHALPKEGGPFDKSSPLLDLKAIREQMPLDSQIVQYSVFDSKTVIWVISKEKSLSVSIAIKAKDLSDHISDFAKLISDPSTADGSDAATKSRKLYDLLILPIRDQVDPSRELCLVPSKALFDLPFSALIGPEGKPIISEFHIIYAPSANVFIRSSEISRLREGPGSESILAVGNPEFERTQFDNLPYLPDAENEVAAVSKLYSPSRRLLVRGDATKDAFLKAIQEADVVHFAGHYISLPNAPMSSYLLLATNGSDPKNSELSNRELSDLVLPRTRLLVIAACRSGAETFYNGEGMMGMSRTMLAAHVPLVVASQWSVDSAATAELMKRFHEFRRQEHLATTEALRRAQLDLLDDQSGKFNSPYYWAAFSAYGGHANF